MIAGHLISKQKLDANNFTFHVLWLHKDGVLYPLKCFASKTNIERWNSGKEQLNKQSTDTKKLIDIFKLAESVPKGS